MNCVPSYRLGDYVDGLLSPEARRDVDRHLADCSTCRAEVAALRALQAEASALPKAIAPARDLWPEIGATLLQPARWRSTKLRLPRWSLALAAAAVVVIVAFAVRRLPSAPAGGWAVTPLSGALQIGGDRMAAPGIIQAGQWLQTDETTHARLEVGAIGEVRVEPNSRVRVVATATTDHRLELSRGTLHALIWAPPRLFFVETPSATAIDLGCAYTLTVDDDGAAVLHVSSGFVALEHDGREAIVPAGMSCFTRRGAGPGTPFKADAPTTLQRALERFDFAGGGADALDDVLRAAGAEDAVTLWHLLERTIPAKRAAVFDALAVHHPPPEGVTRAGILGGDRAMAARWAMELGLYVENGFAP